MKTPTIKKCSKCGEVKPADEFSNKADSKDGKGSRCKSCRKECNAQRKTMLQRDGYKVITEKKCSVARLNPLTSFTRMQAVKTASEASANPARRNTTHNEKPYSKETATRS